MSVVLFHTFSVTIAVVLLNQELRPMSLHVCTETMAQPVLWHARVPYGITATEA
jgi:hypothetical protein